ncbi:MAG: ABC transporter permease [Eisenbergiella sp.]|uniref:ABC transporter permease n=1 Tax=unclassified Eisenbergiella TaxID=2652273 RepID=UPI001FAB0E7B|nr:ABC transporter permease subunit [Eisenbergiella sp. OF01-20]
MRNVLSGEAKKESLWKRVLACRELYLMLLIPVIWYLLFLYTPMYGIMIAFKDYRAAKGIWGSDWVGFEHFERFFSSFYFERIVGNTLTINILSLLFGFPFPIFLALLLGELRNGKFRKALQNVAYIPHFLSAVIVVSIMQLILNPNTGVYNMIRQWFGLPVTNYFASVNAFKPMYIISGIWQNMGWDAILYIAALAGIDTTLYEAASIDGAGRLQKIWHISLPGISSTITIMLLLRCGQIMNIGYEKVLLMQNSLNQASSDVISTYVYRVGILEGNFDYSTAISLFNSVCNILLLLIANAVAKRVNGTSLW